MPRDDLAIQAEAPGARRATGSLRARRAMGGAALGLAAVLATACSPLGILNGMAPRRLAMRDVAYGDDPRQRLDVYLPRPGGSPAPLVVFLYGGAWDSGAKEEYRFVGGALAAQGFITVIPDYRLYPAVRYPVFLEDCAAAFAWTAAQAQALGGSDHLFLMGHSAGAYNAAMLALDRRYLAAAGSRAMPRGTLGLAGPYDFLPLQSGELKRIFGFPTAPATQPIHHVDGRNAPMLLLAGSADKTVQPGNTTRLARAIQAAGGPVTARIYPHIDHREIIGAIGQPFRFLCPSLRDCTDFLRNLA